MFTILRKSGFLSAFLLPALTVAGNVMGGWWNLGTIGFIFLFIPVADALVGVDRNNLTEHERATANEDLYFRLVTWLWVPVQFLFLGWAILQILTFGTLWSPEALLLLVNTGLVTGGIGITVAHELGHKNNAFEQFLSKALLLTVSYMHFFIEHNRGHHVHVATPEDPATARKDESFYRFWIRTVRDSYRHAWQLEATSRERKNLPVIGIGNSMIWFTLAPLLFAGLATWIASIFFPQVTWWVVPVFFFGQSIIGFTLLELVNYVEHYGILRRKDSEGRYERVNPLHSWNTSYLISNFFLFQLQRHSDHHTYASKRYQTLDHFDESPQLPHGYPTMILMALVPPLWFSTMKPLLAEWEKTR